jgi:hypothetical protein
VGLEGWGLTGEESRFVYVLKSESMVGGVKASRVSRGSGRKGAVFNSLKVSKLACEFWNMGSVILLGKMGEKSRRNRPVFMQNGITVHANRSQRSIRTTETVTMVCSSKRALIWSNPMVL